MSRYVLRDDHPYCIKCYENVFANTCDECGKIIGIDSKDLSYKEKHWHEACFLCNKCRCSLVDKQFGSKVCSQSGLNFTDWSLCRLIVFTAGLATMLNSPLAVTAAGTCSRPG